MNRVLAVVLLVLLAAWARASVDELPCVVCHPSRDRAVFDLLSELGGGPLRGESAQAYVCSSCHNGSVIDSRSVLTGGGQHPSGFVPTRTLPREFPLYGGGRLECGTCHSPHGSHAGAKHWLRAAADESTGSCRACHAAEGATHEAHLGKRLSGGGLGALKGLGARAGAGDRIVCETCHRLHGAAGPRLLLLPHAAGQEELCWACHPGSAPGGAQTGAKGHVCSRCHVSRGPRGEGDGSVGAPVVCTSCHRDRAERHLGTTLSPEAAETVAALGGRAGAGGRIVCATCHKVHGPAGSRLLLAPYSPSNDALCRTCHPRLAVKGKPPETPGQPCGDCHRPHAPGSLAAGADGQGVCARCHADRATRGANHAAVSPACSDCHTIHGPSLPQERKAGLLLTSVENGTLCVPCHADHGGAHRGSVLESGVDRSRLAARGVATGPGGEVGCTTCHALHGAREPRLLRAPQQLLCLLCHPRENPYGPQGSRPGVHPVGVLLRQTQRKAVAFAASGGVRGQEGNAVLACSSCHATHGGAVSRAPCRECHPVQAAAQWHGGVPECGACHSVHGSGSPTLACSRCHEKVGTGPHARLAPLPGYPGCTACHDVHGTFANLLHTRRQGDTCFACHGDKRRLLGGSHDTSRGEGAPCDPCHPAHGKGKGKEKQGDNDPAGAGCTECHKEGLTVLSNHGPSGEPAWRQGANPLPLFDRRGARNAFGFVTCPTCHDVHQGPGKGSLRLEAQPAPDLCAGCHPAKSALLGSAHDPRLRGAKTACTGCHPTHSRGAPPPPWTLPDGAQGTWNDRKCSPCHGASPGGGNRANGFSHPVNRLLSEGMKPSGLPLFDATGSRGGRLVACATCHDLHGRETSPGQRVAKFLRKEPAGGDLCTSCHPAQGAVAGTPHDLRGRASSGVCAPCHAAHGATEARALWGLRAGPGDYAANARCRSCHTSQGPVRSEFLLLQYHMKDAETLRGPRGTSYLQYPLTLVDEWALKTGKEPVLALYDKRGGKGAEGNLQCVSCHDPHAWSPLGDFVKPGFGSLGPNVVTHFLRLADTEPLARSACAVCHPKDAAERYRKYHEVWEE